MITAEKDVGGPDVRGWGGGGGSSRFKKKPLAPFPGAESLSMAGEVFRGVTNEGQEDRTKNRLPEMDSSVFLGNLTEQGKNQLDMVEKIHHNLGTVYETTTARGTAQTKRDELVPTRNCVGRTIDNIQAITGIDLLSPGQIGQHYTPREANDVIARNKAVLMKAGASRGNVENDESVRSIPWVNTPEEMDSLK
ncbi:hypothetical protein [Marinomonas sp. THO17]|uniref:hypothetical protein n=1 Tax=Marinomonas sp. THO17 TaxID=3149048 RepID=UPI00336C247C